MPRSKPAPPTLSKIERNAIEQLLGTEGIKKRIRERLKIIIQSESGLTDQKLADKLKVSRTTVNKWRREYARHGLAAILATTDSATTKELPLPPSLQTAKKKTSTEISPKLSEIAEIAGVSTATVSLALRDNRRISQKRRSQIQKIAEKLGYRRNPLLSAYQAQVRSRKKSDYLGTLGWLIDTPHQPDTTWQLSYNRPFLDGSVAEARRLGYQIDQITLVPKVNIDHNSKARAQYLRRLAGILSARGIHGLILPRIYYSSIAVSKMDGIAIIHLGNIEGRIAQLKRAKRLTFPIEANYHEIYPNYFENFRISWQHLTSKGYTRIGLVIHGYAQDNSNQQYHAGLTLAQDLAKDFPKIPLLLIENTPTSQDQKNIEKWVKRWKPEVIICQHNKMCEMLKGMGMAVPQDMSVVHLGVTSEINTWSGIDERMEEIGAATVRTLVGQMQLNRYRPPNIPMRIAIDGEWRNGKTLRKRQG